MNNKRKVIFSSLSVVGRFCDKEYLVPTALQLFEGNKPALVGMACGSAHIALLTVKEQAAFNTSNDDERKSNLFCFGENNKGQCGSYDPVLTQPIPVSFPQDYELTDYEDYDEYYSFKSIEFEKVACGADFTLALDNSRQNLYSVGYNANGQLGIGATKNRYTFHVIKELSKCLKRDNDFVRDMSCGASHALVITQQGKIYSFGSNDFGQLGFGHQFPQSSPALNEFATSLMENEGGIQQVCGGLAHSVFLSNSGKVFTVGRGLEGQCGVNSKTSLSLVHVEGFGEEVKQIAAGLTYTLALGKSGSCYVFGSGLKGMVNWGGALLLQRAKEALWFLHEPTVLDVPKRVREIVATGPYHALLRCEDGDLYGVGSNQDRQLPFPTSGDGQEDTEQTKPYQLLWEDAKSDTDSQFGAGWGFTACIKQ